MADPKAALAALNKKYNVKSSQKDDEEEKKASSGKTTSTNKTTQRESNPAAESNASRPKTALANLNKKYNVTGKKTSDTSSTSRNATLRPSQSSASQVLGRTVGGNGTSSVWRGPAPEDTTRFSGGSYGGGGGRNGRTTSNTTVTEDVFGDNTRKFGNSNIEFKYDPVEKEAEAPVYRRETAENLRKTLEDAETALTQKRESGLDIEADMQRREKDIGKLESQLKSLSDAYKKNQSEETYNRYQQLYSQYEWDIKQYNTLLNEYKGLADNYNKALDEYNTYMDTAKSDASFIETVGDVAWKGISGINRAFTSSLDFLLPTEFLGDYDYVSKLSDYYKSIDEHYQENLDESMYGRGTAAHIAAELGVGTIQALPNALLALASGGTSVLAQGGTLLSGAANSGLASTIGTAVRQMAKSPMYWTSFLQTVGSDYESAKEDGASDLQAAATALISSALNAGVEIGGGLETLPAQLKNGNTSAVKQWVKSMFEEGREEVVQGVISGIMQKAMYDQDKDLYSATDENAIINPGRMAKEFGMGAGVGGILGGAQIGTVSALNAGIDRANNRRMSELGTTYQADRQAVIDEGLSFSPDTEAYQTASQLQAKVDAGGTLTDADIGRAVAANERTIQQEERIAQANIQPVETIEDAAREVVANQEKIAQSEEKGGTERISNPFSGYNAMSDSNPIRQQRLNAEKMVKKMTGYGDYGTRAIMDVMEQEHVTLDQAKAQFQTAYEAGMTDMPVAKVNLTSDLQRIAFNAGKQDYIMSSTKAAEATKYVKVWSKGGGLIQNDYASRLETRTAYMLHAIGKATGTKIIVEEIPAEQNANGYYQDSNGTIHIDINTTQPVMTVVKHELTHRMQALAPKEYRQFRNYAVQVMSETGWNTYGSNTAIESQQQDYFERSGGRVNLNTEEAMDEIAANFTEKILTDEKALNDFVNLVTQSPEHRTMGQKFFQAVREFIDKIKSVFKGNKAKMDAAAQEEFGATVDQLEKAEQLWKDAFKAATQNAQTMTEQAVEFSDANTKYSLRKKDPPKKTGIAYKVFYAKDGQLYPPMVANPGGEGTPVGVWLDADIGKKAAPSKTGRPQVQGGGKGTNAGKMSLSFRPGWHLGDIPQAKQFARKNPETGVKDLFPADFVWAECEYAMDVDYQEEAMSYGYTENGKFRHSYAGLPKLPVDGYYRYRTNPNPDTVPWVITGAMKVTRILTDAETDAICRENGVEPMKRQGGPIDLAKLGLEAGDTEAYNSGKKYALKEDGDDGRRANEGNASDGLEISGRRNENRGGAGRAGRETSAVVQYKNLSRKAKGKVRSAILSAISENAKDGRDALATFGSESMAQKIYDQIVVNDGSMPGIERMFPTLREKVAKAALEVEGIEKDYVVTEATGKAAWTQEHIDKLYEAFSVTRTDIDRDYSKAYAVTMSPEQFLSLTATEIGRANIELEAVKKYGELDVSKLKEDQLSPQLYIDMENGVVDAHEGRHRMVLLQNAGIDSVPVVVIPSNQGDKYHRTKIGRLRVSGQEWSQGKAPGNVTLKKLIPLSQNYKPEIEQTFGGDAEVRFSLKDSTGKTLTDEQQKFFKDSKVRDKDGNLLVVYHGTGSDFTVFDKSRVGENYPVGISDLGFYFTPYREDAVGYASNATSDRSGRRVMASYLNLKNPLIVEDEGWGSAASQADIRHSDLMRWAKDGGHDGIIVRSTDEIMDDDGTADAIYIAFNSNQIKDVTNENPTEDTDIRFSLKEYTDQEKRDHVKKALDYFGKTYNWKETGYVTPSGNKIDFSGKHEGGPGGYRTVDHRDIREALGDDYGGDDYSGAMVQFMAEGNIRIMPESGGINLCVKPTKAQESALSDFISRERGEVVVDFDEPGGDTVHSMEYPRGTHANKVLAYIRDYFDNGKSAKQSEVAMFHNMFSLKGQNDMMRENAKLKETVDGLREQFKVTTFAQVDKKSLDRFTKKLLKDYQSGAEINDTRDALNALYGYMANGENGEGPVWNEVYKRAYETAQNILENASVLDDEMYQEYKALRDELRTRGMTLDRQFTSDLVGYESINDFRKAYMGRIKLVKDGTPVDVVYSDLASRYPEFFNEERTQNPADQLLEIAEVLDGMQPTEHNPYSYNMREAATWLANDIIERFYELPQAKPTFADKAEQKLTKQVIKDAKKMERMRYQKNERIKALIEENRKKVKAVQAKERAKRAEAVQDVKEHYKAKEAKSSDSRKAQVLRAKITRHAQDMSAKLLRPTDKQHIPEKLRGPVAALLEAINQESAYELDAEGKRVGRGQGVDVTKRTAAFRALRDQYAAIVSQEDGSMVIDPDLLGDSAVGFQGLFDKVLSAGDIPMMDMNLEQLATVWNVLRAVEHSVSTAGKVLSNAKFQGTVEWANAIQDETSSRRQKNSLTNNHMLIDLETPYTFFSHYGESGVSIYRMLRDAQDSEQMMHKAIEEEVGKIVDAKTVKSLEKQTHQFTTERGDKLTLTTAHVMEIYELMKREQAYDHLLKGGIVQPEIKGTKIRRGTDAILLTAGDLGNITKVLTDDQINIADGLQKLMSGKLADYGNEASMKAYGYKKFTGTDYWPIKSAREAIHTSVEKGGNQPRSIKNIGMAKNVVPNASTSLDIGGIFRTFASHEADMVDYAAWLCPMEDASRLYNFKFRDEMGQQTGKTMKGLLDRVGGTGAQRYWSNLVEDIQNGINAPSDSPTWDAVGKGVGRFKGAAVGGNLRVVIQQPTAFMRANAVMSPVDLSAGLVKGVVKGNGWKKALEHSPIAVRKATGGFDISSTRTVYENLFDGRNVIDKTNDKLSRLAGAADAVTWGKLWNASEWAVKRNNPNIEVGSDEFWTEVNKVFTNTIDQTQVVDGVLQRSNIMRSSNAVVKQATSFMGEPIMSLNLLMRSYDNFRYQTDSKKRVGARKVMGRACLALVSNIVVNALAQSVMDAFRSDDEEKKWLERYLEQLTGIKGDEETTWEKIANFWVNGNLGTGLNLVGSIPFAKDVMSIWEGYDVSRTEMEIVSDVIRAAKDAINSDGKKSKPNAITDLVFAASKFLGVSASNLKRDAVGFARSFAVETDDYRMQYVIDKFLYNVNGSGNTSRFVGILYRAYKNDHDAYKYIYDDLIASGFDPEKIQRGMESRMKKDQGVTKASELESRYLNPTDQTEWDSKMKPIQSSSVWKSANAEQRDNLEDDLYTLITGTGEDIENKRKYISDGKAYGMSETDYLLYELAKDMYDEPNESGEYGSYTNEERANAILSIDGISDGAMAYLLDTKDGYEAYAGGVDMESYLERIGSGGDVNVEKLVDAKNYGLDEDVYYDFLDMLDKYDKPTESGKMGTFTQEEAKAAVSAMSGLTRAQRAYLFQSVDKRWKKNPWR